MADLKEAYRRFDPSRPLAGDLLEYYYVQRPSDPMGVLAKELNFSDSPLHILVAGQRGVGKTTELVRLADSLRPPALGCGSHFLNRSPVIDHEAGIAHLTIDLYRNARVAGLPVTSPGQEPTEWPAPILSAAARFAKRKKP